RTDYCPKCKLHGGRHRPGLGHHRDVRPYLALVTEADLHEVLMANFPTALRVAGGIVGPSLARDCAHEAVAKLLELGPYLRLDGNLASYFLTKTWSVSMDTLRRSRRETPVAASTLEVLDARVR